MIPTHGSDRTSRREILVNHLKQLNDYDFSEPHRHHYFEFFYFVKGGGFHKIDFIKFPIESNSAHIVAPGQVHQMKRDLDSEGYVVLFELNALEAPKEIANFLFEHACLDASENKPSYLFEEEQREMILQKINAISSYAKDDSEISKLSLRNEIQSLCIECMKIDGKMNTYTKQSQYLQFRKLLHANCTRMKKVREYAKALHISEKAVNDLVKKHTGESTSSIIYKQLIMEAKRLLNTKMSIKETAYSLNFEDPAHFSKFFKSQTGIPPSDFQNYT